MCIKEGCIARLRTNGSYVKVFEFNEEVGEWETTSGLYKANEIVSLDLDSIQFNTGRLYTKEGQIIRAIKIDDNVVFSDMSRGIYAFLENCNLNVHEIMSRYDVGDYTWTSTLLYTLVKLIEREDWKPKRYVPV